MGLANAVRMLRTPRRAAEPPRIDPVQGEGDRLDDAVRRWSLGECDVEKLGSEFYVSSRGTLGIRLKSDALSALIRDADR